MKEKIIVSNSGKRAKTSKRYFLEKTSDLLYNLLVGPGDAKSRLRENELLIMYSLHLDVPNELIPEQKKILAILTKKREYKVGEKTLRSSFQNTISSIRNSTASEIIKKINSFYHEVDCHEEL